MSKKNANEEISSYFQQLSTDFKNTYDDSGLKKHTKKIINYFSKIELEKLNFLEIGCGIGGLLIEFLKLGANYTIGFDLSENMIENAKNIAKDLNFEKKSYFLTGDFNSFDFSNLDIIHKYKPGVVIADRVFCCSPFSFEILNKIISLNPQYIVIVLPRRNVVHRKMWRIKTSLRRMNLKIKSNIPMNYYKEADLTAICKEHQYFIDFHSYRYVWETIIYKKED